MVVVDQTLKSTEITAEIVIGILLTLLSLTLVIKSRLYDEIDVAGKALE